MSPFSTQRKGDKGRPDQLFFPFPPLLMGGDKERAGEFVLIVNLIIRNIFILSSNGENTIDNL
jgi:hypothetical protein